MSKILDQIQRARLEVLNGNKIPTTINLTVDQGFELLREFNNASNPTHDVEDAEDILIKRDEERMINFMNKGRCCFLKIHVFKMVE